MRYRAISVSVLMAVALLLSLRVVLAQELQPAEQQSADAHSDSVGTAFTYQGQLTDDGAAAVGPCDFRFILFDTEIGGSQVGPVQERTGVNLTDGRFAVDLDFGAGAFDGDARWLEIAVQCTGDATYTTLGRQALKAAPYAIYASGAPWSGLQGVPGGLSDGDDDTTYSAGAGLTLVGNQFRVSYGGSGSAGTVSRSDHHHLGQTWTGTGSALTIDGSFGSPSYASLSLSNNNSSGDGLRVTGAGDDGMQVSSAGGDGVYVASTGDDGLDVNSATDDGVRVSSAGGDGVDVGYTDGYGININEANLAAIRVGLTSGSAVYVEQAAWGLYVGNATQYGASVRGRIAGGYFRDSDSGTYAYLGYGSYGVYSNGTKNFVQEHPTDPSKAIVYASLEGGEAGTYYRGTARLAGGTAVVELPEHFGLVTEDEGLTVQVTPREDCNGLYVAEVTTRAIVVKELMGGASDARFDFLINGIRAGYADYEVIQDASSAMPQDVLNNERARTGE